MSFFWPQQNGNSVKNLDQTANINSDCCVRNATRHKSVNSSKLDSATLPSALIEIVTADRVDCNTAA